MSITAIREALEAGPTDWAENYQLTDSENEVWIGIQCGAMAFHGSRHGRETNANFVLACNPSAIKELLDELDAAKKDAQRLRAIVGGKTEFVICRWDDVEDEFVMPSESTILDGIDSAMEAKE